MTSAAPSQPKSRRPGLADAVFWSVALALGLAGWAYCLSGAQADRAWSALLINFLFFTPLAAGMVTWPGVVRVSRGEWAGGLERAGFAGLAFAPISLIALGALYVGRAHWAGWITNPNPANSFWMNTEFIFLRDAAALVVFWLVAARVVSKWPENKASRGGWLAFLYAVVFSLVAFDLVMGLDPGGYSALLGGYFFVSGMYAGVVAWTIRVLARRNWSGGEQLGDLGKLIVTFSLLTTYMMFSQLIVIWYENLPPEARFIIPRMDFQRYGWVSAGLLALVYFGPLVLFLGRKAKRAPIWLGGVSMCLLVGLWVERWWLVTPTLHPSPKAGEVGIGLPELSATLAFLAALMLCFRVYHRFADADAGGEGRS